MENILEAKALLSKYVTCKGIIYKGSCSLCCASNGGGKAKYQDFIEKVNK